MLCAQDPTGRVLGRVLDSSGSVIPDVRIQAANPDTGVVVSAQSNTAVSNTLFGKVSATQFAEQRRITLAGKLTF